MSDWTSCQDCEHEENKENNSTTLPQESEEDNETANIWMCLKCGHRGCGRNSEDKHAIKHYETPRSDPHCLVVSMDTWSYSRTGHLAQLLTNLKKQTCADPTKRPQKRVKEEDSMLEPEQTETVKAEENEDKENRENNKNYQKKNAKKEGVGKSQKSSITEDRDGVSVKGLSNLGNTCFFNAVIQNLSQTQLLRQTLNNVTKENMSLNIEPGASSTLRVSSGIMEALKQCGKSTDGEQLKTLVKEYEKNGFPKNFVDQVFGGEMTSTIMCQQCKTVSVVTEMFLDLSLPVSDEAYRKKNQKKGVQKTSESSTNDRNSPVLTNGNDDDIPTGAGSKYQQKKAKKQAKKQAKNQKRQQKLGSRVTLDSLTTLSPADQTECANEGEKTDGETHEEAPVGEETVAADQGEKNLDPVKAETEKEEGEDLVTDCDSSATSSVSNRFTVLSEEQHSKDSVLDDDKMSDMEQEAEEDTELVSEMEKVTLDDAFIQDPDAGNKAWRLKKSLWRNMTEGDTQILYSLYGIVEHSGTMRSGHYTAYVKVRPEHPKPLSNGLTGEGDAEPPRGTWFHVSDTSVQPVSESKVQSCQAYLLFYERIL
ncbi:hypothetical protein INR49_016425 [Caranx melampygus]|nr:hypothetical protein INR49_016425 [Caranx melampygus]